MNNALSPLRWITGALLLGAALTTATLGLTTAAQSASPTKPNVVDPAQALYTEECGSCHLAYPARFLPAASWQAIMTGLDDHFGENAELDAEQTAALTAYLKQQAGDQASRGKNSRMLKNLDKSVPPPLRITELPYFKKEHREIPRKRVQDNPEVGSFSQCNACHQGANRGKFDEDRVSIPGFGRWDD